MFFVIKLVDKLKVISINLNDFSLRKCKMLYFKLYIFIDVMIWDGNNDEWEKYN